MISRLVILLLLLVPALSPVEGAQRLNILLIVTDDQRADTIHALGNTYIDTPHLDRLVAEGSSFSRAVASNPHCVPSRAEIMTGTTGFTNGSWNGAFSFAKVKNPPLVTWARAMRSGGYHAWYSGKWMNSRNPKAWGYEETRNVFSRGGAGSAPQTYPKSHNGRVVTGYRTYTFKTDDGKPEPEKGIGLTPDTDRIIADGAIEFIDRQRRSSQPFFLHVNFTAPHDPLIIPKGYESRYDPAAIPLPPNFAAQHPFNHGYAGGRDEALLSVPRDPAEVKRELAAYYAVISHLDEQVGRILDALRLSGEYENTVVIFTSDHGLALGSHGLMGKLNMYEHGVGVPLIIAGPGLPRNKRFAAQTYLRDLYPTACELAGIPIPATVEAKSLVPVMSGLVREIHPEIYGYVHVDGMGDEFPIQRMVRTERWKLIYYSHLNHHQLFDLANDPYELRNLASDPRHAGIQSNLQEKLTAWFKPRIEHFTNGTNSR